MDTLLANRIRMPKKKDHVTIEKLAEITAHAFQEVQEQLDTLATKDDLAVLRAEMKENFHTLDQGVAKRLDSFLNVIRHDYEHRLTRAERDIRELQRHP